MPTFSLRGVYIVFFLVRNASYLFSKHLEVLLYNSLVYNTLKAIENPAARSDYFKLFQILQNPKNNRSQQEAIRIENMDIEASGDHPLLAR
jgi:hypothetical protein